MAVLCCVVKMLADRPVWDGSWWPITSVAYGDVLRLLAVHGACLFLHLCECLRAPFFRTRNIHTLHLPVLCLCWPLGCLVDSLCLWVSFLERGVFTHLFRQVVFDSSLACMLASRSLWAPFLERGIFTHLFARLFMSDYSLACVFPYTCVDVCGHLF